jgi:methylmalonyl-CoA/ethylmalonyl-CoA epimerase
MNNRDIAQRSDQQSTINRRISMNPAWLGPIRQIGYVVDSVDAAMAHWTHHTRIGPWTCFRNVTVEGRQHGEATHIRMNVGLAYQGELQIELIEVLNDTPSPYRDANGRLLVGMHHIAWLSRNFEHDVARAIAGDLEVCFQGGNASTRVAYLEQTGLPGTRFELIQVTDELEAMFLRGIEVSRSWDGSYHVENINLDQTGN